MQSLLFIPTLLIILLPLTAPAGWETSPQLQSGLNILAPVSGQVIQGSVIVRGSTGVDGFQAYEIDFSYSQDFTHTWFLVQESSFPSKDGILAVWDTTTITDGEYSLRLLVMMADGTQKELLIDSLRVRNYSPVETNTPNPNTTRLTLAPGTPVPTLTPRISLTPILTSLPPTLTPLPTNSAEITQSQMLLTIGKGAAFTVGIIAILGAYLGVRSVFDRRNN